MPQDFQYPPMVGILQLTIALFHTHFLRKRFNIDKYYNIMQAIDMQKSFEHK